MVYFLIIISLFIKEILPNQVSISSIFYSSRLPIYLYLVIIILMVIAGRCIKIKRIFNLKVILFGILIIGFQCIAMMLSYMEIGNNTLNKNPIKQFISLLIFIICIVIHYIVVKLAVNTKKNINRFIKGNLIALIMLLIISYLQFLYLLLPNSFSTFVSFIGSYFENRVDREDWYIKGSYVQTLQRINGFNSEAGYLAVQLLVVFVPFILASIKNKFNIFFNKVKYNPIHFYLLLLSIIVILFFAKTTTGILAIIVILLFLWISLPLKRKYLFTILLIISGVLVYYWIINKPLVLETLNNTLFNKNVNSTQNRFGSTIGLINTWLKHFVLGVGWNYHDFYLFKNVPEWSKNNYEYQYVFYSKQFYPILSVFFGWLAEFGSIFVILMLSYIYILLKDLRDLSKQAEHIGKDESEIKLIYTIKDSAHYFILFYFICSMFSFLWYESIYLILFFFFVVVRQFLKEKINK